MNSSSSSENLLKITVNYESIPPLQCWHSMYCLVHEWLTSVMFLHVLTLITWFSSDQIPVKYWYLDEISVTWLNPHSWLISLRLDQLLELLPVITSQVCRWTLFLNPLTDVTWWDLSDDRSTIYLLQSYLSWVKSSNKQIGWDICLSISPYLFVRQ